MNVNDLLENLHPETVMQIWGDDTITNVYKVGNGLYTFDSHMMSHGEHITLRVSAKLCMDLSGDLLFNVINTLEIGRQPTH